MTLKPHDKCNHSRNGNPAQCSQCLGAQVRRVEITEAAVLVDGKPQPERPRQRFGGK